MRREPAWRRAAGWVEGAELCKGTIWSQETLKQRHSADVAAAAITPTVVVFLVFDLILGVGGSRVMTGRSPSFHTRVAFSSDSQSTSASSYVSTHKQ